MMKNLFEVVHHPNKLIFKQIQQLTENQNANQQLIGRKTAKPIFKVLHRTTKEKLPVASTDLEVKGNVQIQSLHKENSNLFNTYDLDNYEKSRYLDLRDVVNLNHFPRQKHFFGQRTRIVDFMVEVFSSFTKSDIPTLFHAVRLMDGFLSKSHVDNKQFFLVGVACIFISSKYEDTHCIQLETLVKEVAHDSLSMDQIKLQEMLILKTIEWDLMFTTPYEFIKAFFFDFSQSNKKNIETFRLAKTIQLLESKAVAVAMIMLHNEKYCEIKNVTKAIVSILYALNVLCNDQVIKDTYIITFMREWVEFLVKETQTPVEYVNDIFKNLEEYIDIYQKIQYIGKHALRYFV